MMEEINDVVRKMIKEHRAGLNLSLREYAELFGVSHMTIFEWESGKMPGVDIAQKLNAEHYPGLVQDIRTLALEYAIRRLEEIAGTDRNQAKVRGDHILNQMPSGAAR
jgi:transcriptional regulator with XRE-family HTH domain